MRHRHRGLSTYELNGQRQGDEHPHLGPFGVCGTIYLFYVWSRNLEQFCPDPIAHSANHSSMACSSGHRVTQ